MAAVYAGSYYPETLRATVAYQHGQRAEKARDFAGAIQEYQSVLKSYPESSPALARLGISYYQSGNTLQAIWTLGEVWGQEIPNGISAEVDNVFRQIKNKAGVK
jgi:tetratricopeptide (TPR) repeat protein